MKRSLQYRLYPTKSQNNSMCKILGECRWLYNHFIGERKNSYEREGVSVNVYSQINSITDIKKHIYFTSYSQTLQEVGNRVELAYQSFFRRVKNGEKPGYPRFKSYGRYNSFTYPQKGFNLNTKTIYLSKIGDVKIKLHRPIQGRVKTIIIKRSPTNKWFIAISCEGVGINTIDTCGDIGVDVGIKSFATLSDGSKIDSPRFFNKSEKDLSKAQRKLSNNLNPKNRKVVATIHENIKNRRKDFIFKLAHKITRQYKNIYIEDLNINRMKENHRFSKSIHDAAWAMFFQVLIYKAEEAGGKVIPVNPAYTSQDCSSCGTRILKTLSDRIHRCECGLVLDRDHNAAINILAMGRHGLVKT